MREETTAPEKTAGEFCNHDPEVVPGKAPTCTITGQGICRDMDIVIPEVIDGYRVTMISSNRFLSTNFDKSITSVDIPNSVTSIGDNAFTGCKSLASVRYTGTKKQWKQIDLPKHWRDMSAIRKIECKDGAIKYLF